MAAVEAKAVVAPAKRELAMWRTLDRKLVLQRGKWLKLEEHKVDIGGGKTIDDWTWYFVCALLLATPLG